MPAEDIRQCINSHITQKSTADTRDHTGENTKESGFFLKQSPGRIHAHDCKDGQAE